VLTHPTFILLVARFHLAMPYCRLRLILIGSRASGCLLLVEPGKKVKGSEATLKAPFPFLTLL